MQSEPSQDRTDPRIPPPLGIVRHPTQHDPRLDSKILAAVGRIAPGTALRSAIDDIIRSSEGALIVIGEPNELAFLFSGGIKLEVPFTPQLLYEVAKMDGAIIVNAGCTKLAYANVQLMPDPTIPSDETGTRHRTAERVAKQTGALVISISQQRATISAYVGPTRYQLEAVPDVLAKTTQALATLDKYGQRLQQVLARLTALEFQNAVVLDDVLVVLQRAEMTTRMAAEIERDCVELGAEARLIQMQLQELIGEIPAERAMVVHDYHVDGAGPRAELALEGLHALPYRQLLDSERLAPLLAFPREVNPHDHSVTPRGFRLLSRIPRLPEGVVRKVVSGLGDLDGIVRASQSDLEAISGVGAVRAREIREGLRRLQEQNLVERYLQL